MESEERLRNNSKQLIIKMEQFTENIKSELPDHIEINIKEEYDQINYCKGHQENNSISIDAENSSPEEKIVSKETQMKNNYDNSMELSVIRVKIEPNDENNLNDDYSINMNIKQETLDIDFDESDANTLLHNIDNADYNVGYHEEDSNKDKLSSLCIVKRNKEEKKNVAKNLNKVEKNTNPRKLNKERKYGCDICDYKAKTSYHLRDHKLVHGKKNIGCNICGKMFRRKNNLRGHLWTHSDERPYKCSYCPKTFKERTGYRSHLLGVHDIVQRISCDFETSKRIELERRAAEHIEGASILCELCDYRCKIERQLLTHKRVVHEGYKYACDICDYPAKTLDILRGHKLVHGERNIGCNICGKMFRRKCNLNDHLKTHSDEIPYKCSHCPKTFKHPLGYKLHLLGAHNIVQPLSCGYCNFETDSRQELNIHKASLHHSKYMRLLPVKNDEGDVTQTIIFACDVCKYVANNEAYLKSHLVVHEEKRLPCEVCGKLFLRIGGLKEHQRSHSEKRPYACPVCPSKAFKDNKVCRKHIARFHDVIEMLECDKCNYKTHNKDLMHYHDMKHSGQLRFQCSECSYACMTIRTMRRHKLVHDTVMPVYSCDMCDFKSVSDRAVKRHKKVHVEK